MPVTSGDIRADGTSPSVETLTAFASSWEHIESELRCLDLRLRRELVKQRRWQHGDALASFRGLVITDAEAEGLLTPEDRSVDEPNPAELAQVQSEIESRRSAARRAKVYLSLARLTELFSLTRLQEECLTVCLAPELDRKYEKLYGYLQDDATRKRPALDLILNLLAETVPEKLEARDALGSARPLMRFRLLETVEGNPGDPTISRPLKVDERIVNFLLGSAQVDARLERFARLINPPRLVEGVPASHDFYQSAYRFIVAYLQEPPQAGRNLILHLYGPASSDKRMVVEELCGTYGLPMLVADLEAMMAGSVPFEQAVWLLGREAALQSAVLLVENMDSLTGEAEKHAPELKSLLEAAKTFSRVTFLCGNAAWQPKAPLPACVFLSQAVAGPDLQRCKRLWEEGLEGVSDDADAAVLAGKFRFGASQIKDALTSAENLARWRSPANWRVTASDIYAAGRILSSPKLGALARKIQARYTWDEIVLPDDNLALLKALCEQARHRQLVYGEWGFDRKLSLGKGLNALFSGPPGTGKTMAAEVVARELQLDLYRIDLSQIVSKYIGETEKNLHQIFLEAQAGNAILFFDEADALFGKRSDVKDAHDRFANIEVGYLLQKMEEYEGVAILATNLSRNMDEAFARRMHFVIEFPFPDEKYRKRIWQVAFPQEAPVAEEVDFGILAHEIKLPGGNIRNIALAAAFYAAGNGRVIGMPQLREAARREHQKLGRTWDWNVSAGG